MIRNELREMISLAERLSAVGEPAVLATLFSANGSSYRPLGSMMLGGPSSALMVGGVSGGCLEEYISRRGRTLTEQQAAVMLSFDSDPDAYQSDAPLLGCGGAIEVLVERFTSDHLAFLRQLAAAHDADEPSVSLCEIEFSKSTVMNVERSLLEQKEQKGVRTLFVGNEAAFSRCQVHENSSDPFFQLVERAMVEERSIEGPIGDNRRAMIYYIRPVVRLVILGAGNDAQPLCTLAHSLGWHVSIVDRRARMATRHRFPEADHIIADDWWKAIESITFTARTAVVMMTHSVGDDAEILPLLAERPAAYIGVLGPEQRRRWLLENAESGDLPESFRQRLRGPVGLDLGERSASGIAVSIISEILAELNGRSAKPLFCERGVAREAESARIATAHIH